MIADGRGRAVAFALAPGQAHELPLAPGLLGRLPRVPLWVVGDRGYSSSAFRELRSYRNADQDRASLACIGPPSDRRSGSLSSISLFPRDVANGFRADDERANGC